MDWRVSWNNFDTDVLLDLIGPDFFIFYFYFFCFGDRITLTEQRPRMMRSLSVKLGQTIDFNIHFFFSWYVTRRKDKTLKWQSEYRFNSAMNNTVAFRTISLAVRWWKHGPLRGTLRKFKPQFYHLLAM